MKIDVAGDKSILVELSKEDMTRFNITYDELDYSNISTRKVLFEIMQQIKIETGKFLNSTDKLQIDVMPDLSGGCLMIFTDCTVYRLSVCDEMCLYVFKNINDIIDCARAFEKSEATFPEASLYKRNEDFVMTVKISSQHQKSILSEFAEYGECDILEEERLMEYCECIKKDSALEIFCSKSL